MREDETQFKPRVLVEKDGRPDEWWMFEGRVFVKNRNVGLDTPEAGRELSDVSARIAHMDQLGVDHHVLYPSIFLRPLTRKHNAEIALCRSYNRWLGDLWAKAPDRLGWVTVLPLMSMETALEELHWSHNHGARGVFMRSNVGDMRLSDPYLFPLYQEAGKLDMPITVHSSQGNFGMWDLFQNDGFGQFKLTVVAAFHELLMSRTPERFPDLRWAFVEVTSEWVPYALNDMGLRWNNSKRQGRAGFWGRDTLKENRMYVACQTTDNLEHVIEAAGDENIVIGSDYGHNDTSSELLALQRLQEDGKVDPVIVGKILGENPARLYAY